jgi:hypothetical protein
MIQIGLAFRAVRREVPVSGLRVIRSKKGKVFTDDIWSIGDEHLSDGLLTQ